MPLSRRMPQELGDNFSILHKDRHVKTEREGGETEDELGALAPSFNEMACHLKRSEAGSPLPLISTLA